MLLTKKEENECNRLLKWNKIYKKRNLPATWLFIGAILVSAYLVSNIPEGKNALDYPMYTYPALTVLTIGWGLAYYFWKTAKPLKISGYNLHIIRAYKAYDHLTQYENDLLPNHIDKATNEFENMLLELEIQLPQNKQEPPFKSLSSPVNELLEKIDFRLIPAIEMAEKKDVSKLKNTIANLIRFFSSESFDDIKNINKELEQYKDLSEDEKPIKEKLFGSKSWKITIIILVSLTIGGLGVLIASLAGGTQQTLITVGAAVTIGSAAILFNKIKYT